MFIPYTYSRSTKAGASTPATPPAASYRHQVAQPLNEGRGGLNPGDTRRQWVEALRSGNAQRRPGPQPRRHLQVFTPVSTSRTIAQRRLGPQPQRHPDQLAARRQRRLRSTKAGASTPATRRGRRHHVPAGQRSTKAGASTPATPDTKIGPRPVTRPAQRRPGPQPRRHEAADIARHPQTARSTKAGASTPATLLILPGRSFWRGNAPISEHPSPLANADRDRVGR